MKVRNTNIEWLRIIAMFLIVFSHFSCHGYSEMGGVKIITNVFNLSYLKLTFTGNLGTGLFMIITGYFLCTSSKVKTSRLLSVVIQVFTYSLLCYIIYTIMYGGGHFRPKEIFVALTPLIHETNWYFSAYVLIYLFHPHLNRLILNLNRQELRNLIVLMAIVWGVIPVFFFVKFNRTDFLFFSMMYFIGAYMRLYPDGRYAKSYKKALFLSVLAWIFIASMPIWTTKQISDLASLFYLNGSPLVIILSSSLFLLFLNKNEISYSSFINTVAACTGGIYLLHENPYVRSILYTDIFHLERYMKSDLMSLFTIGFVVLTFVVCAVIEFIRKSVYEVAEKVIIKNKK